MSWIHRLLQKFSSQEDNYEESEERKYSGWKHVQEDTPNQNHRELNQAIIKSFNLDEIQDLCIELSIDYDGLAGSGKASKVRELVTYFHRKGRMGDLLAACEKLRPDIDWSSLGEFTNTRATEKDGVTLDIDIGFGFAMKYDQYRSIIRLSPVLRTVVF